MFSVHNLQNARQRCGHFWRVSIAGNATHASHISIDGTFGKCPSTHPQSLTRHSVRWRGYSFPFAFALQPNKSNSLYENAFDEIDAAAMRTCQRPVFNRTDFTVLWNFESGSLKALVSIPCTVEGVTFTTQKRFGGSLQNAGFQIAIYLTPTSPVCPVFNGRANVTVASLRPTFFKLQDRLRNDNGLFQTTTTSTKCGYPAIRWNCGVKTLQHSEPTTTQSHFTQDWRDD